jgi:hypothetical protein
LGASSDDRADPFEPAQTRFASRSLGDVPVDDYEANALLGQVIGLLDTGRRDKPAVTLAVLLEATGKVPRESKSARSSRLAVNGYVQSEVSQEKPARVNVDENQRRNCRCRLHKPNLGNMLIKR